MPKVKRLYILLARSPLEMGESHRAPCQALSITTQAPEELPDCCPYCSSVEFIQLGGESTSWQTVMYSEVPASMIVHT